MTEAHHTETIDAPIAAVYQHWLDVGSFPSFMPAVRSVTTSSDFYSQWTLAIGGLTRSFDAEIVEQLPEQRVSWRSITGDLALEGRAEFQAASDVRTTVTLTVTWNPTTAAERAAAALGADDRALRVALGGFKRHVESSDHPAGRSYVTLRSVDARSDSTAEPVETADPADAEKAARPSRLPRHLKEPTDT
ncbi:SRPBCC family protein [Herbiconiux sp. 11R-BC]|uniref:SRPBCC family protein n=1 Tax=Herbiconiux sp. 11R-BC TaxID=3111637 RepID=UPI003C068BAE